MNIQLLDSWIREHIKTNATPKEFAKALSLTSVSIERMEKKGNDFLYDIEITTNRPDVASVIGIAKEAAAVLPQFGYSAQFIPLSLKNPEKPSHTVPLTIENDKTLVNRVCAVVMEVSIKPSPELIKNRLEASGIRSLNNCIDITNYIMREIGYPTHVMDYDAIATKKLVIRSSKKGESIKTLDEKTYTLNGNDIVADDTTGTIVDLLGIMGLSNSVVKDTTTRIIFFINNVDAHKVRSTSLAHGIRTEAAVLNEKHLDPESAYDALLFGISLFQKHAKGKLLSPIIDIYPNKPKEKKITVQKSHIDRIIGIPIPEKTSLSILKTLGFSPITTAKDITVTIPTNRLKDISIPEDIIEEIARVYGYHQIPTTIPSFSTSEAHPILNEFYWEDKTKHMLKYWGFTEVYTYPLISKDMYQGDIKDAVTLENPLGEEFSYMRNSLIPSLLKVVSENKNYESLSLFEIGNTYTKTPKKLPKETRMLTILMKKPNLSFYAVKGVLEQLCHELGISHLTFTQKKEGIGADIQYKKTFIGSIVVLDTTHIVSECNFETLLSLASPKKTYTPLAKYPSLFEDITIVIDETIPTGDIVSLIQTHHEYIKSAHLIDKYQDSRTIRIEYHAKDKTVSTTDIAPIRTTLFAALTKKFHATLK